MIVVFPHPPGSGGPGSFQIRFENELKNNGHHISYAGEELDPDIVIVVGGTKRLFWLWKMKRKGVPVLYRLDGLAWLHRYKGVGIKSYLLSEFRNSSSKFIHAFIADHIIYQSQFVKEWWERSGWAIKEQYLIIYNGVEVPELDFSIKERKNTNRLVVLEGTIDYSPYAIDLLNTLAIELSQNIKIEVYGRFEDQTKQEKLHSRIQYFGSIPRDKVFEVLQGSVYLSLDINPACPNTVIEAMACGAPVVGFDTGSMKELVTKDVGCIVPYGSNSWELEYPDIGELIDGIYKVQLNWKSFSENARKHAVHNFDFQIIVQQYMKVIEDLIT